MSDLGDDVLENGLIQSRRTKVAVNEAVCLLRGISTTPTDEVSEIAVVLDLCCKVGYGTHFPVFAKARHWLQPLNDAAERACSNILRGRGDV